jgi:hypothetical protein
MTQASLALTSVSLIQFCIQWFSFPYLKQFGLVYRTTDVTVLQQLDPLDPERSARLIIPISRYRCTLIKSKHISSFLNYTQTSVRIKPVPAHSKYFRLDTWPSPFIRPVSSTSHSFGQFPSFTRKGKFMLISRSCADSLSHNF